MRLHAPVLALFLAGCTYGPVVDRSGFESAALPADGGTVVVAYRVLRYRPAEGIAAFPDGGVPRYLEDRVAIGAVPVEGGRPRVLQRLENRGRHGALHVSVRAQEADPGRVLVLMSEEPSGSVTPRRRWWRLDPSEGKALPYPDLEADLRSRGRKFGSREFGDVRVLAPDGALLIGAEGPSGPELWLLDPAGEYRLVDGFEHFYGVRGDELYYWMGHEAVVRNWRTGARRVVARHDPQVGRTTRLIPDDPTARALERMPEDHRLTASVSPDRSAVNVGRRGPDGWTEAPLAVDLAPLRR